MSDQIVRGFELRMKAELRARPTLEGRAWPIRLVWNSRLQLWIFDVFDSTGADVGRGIAAVVSTDLLGGIAGDNRPPGQIWIRDNSGRQVEAGRFALGKTHDLCYRPVATVLAVAGTALEVP